MNDEYTKISWEDGTVIKKATVNINGTEYEVEPELISGTTPINSTNLNHMDDGIKGLYDKHLINKTVIELIAVSENEPEEFITGNKYYNLLNNLIYTAISDSSWSENGEEPVSTYLYVDLNDSKLYYYDGTNFKAYGGGSGGKTSEEVIISEEQPTGDDWKLWINNNEVEQLSEVVDNLNGNQTTLAPSVRAVKEALNDLLYYKEGDVIDYSVNAIVLNGFLTSAGLTHHIGTLFLEKSLKNINRIEALYARATVRQNGNYILGSGTAYADIANDNLSLDISGSNAIRVKYQTTEKSSSSINNEAISTVIKIKIKLHES